MAEEKKGHVKVTIDIEINEPMMDVIRDCVTRVPEMMAKFKKEK